MKTTICNTTTICSSDLKVGFNPDTIKFGNSDINKLYFGNDNVDRVYFGNTKVCEYNPALTFVALSAGSTIAYSITGELTINIQTSTDMTNWSNWDGTAITLTNIGDKIYVRNTENSLSISEDEYFYFIMSGLISASGNIKSMINNGSLTDYCYSFMFDSCTSLTTAPALSATTLTEGCYIGMFYGCTNLTTAPELPATTLTERCYSYMFYGCTSLTSAPSLPATTLADNCYSYMFYGCTSLTSSPNLPATTLANYCYYQMFHGCTSLTSTPSLPATTLANYCYQGMFYGCTSLTSAPELPATTLANYCYFDMFSGCTSLTSSPNLPATTLANYCYYQMFHGCTSLTSTPSLPATTLANYCYQEMFYGCTSLTTAPALPATTLSNNCYQSMFSGCTGIKLSTTATSTYQIEYRIPTSGTGTTATNALTNMFTDTGGTFTGTPSINTYYYLYGQAEIYYGYNSSANTLYLSKTQTSTATTKGTKDVIANYKTTCVTVVFENDLRLPFYDDLFKNFTNLVNVQGFENVDLNNKTAKSMFEHCTSLTAAPTLSATTLAKYCYQDMFYGCTSLTTSPNLPATTLTERCYSYMFYGCTSLTTAPSLTATTLANNCYQGMFYGCTSLTTAPSLPATTLADNCYSYMFRGCTSLTTAPSLPATTLTTECYRYMFRGCTSLTAAPSLPATTLTTECYRYMFSGCTNLTTAPELPATTLANYCYGSMFQGCTSLASAPALPATTLSNNCYQSMFSGCTGIKLSDEQTIYYQARYRIPTSGTGTTATNALTNMFTDTGGTFTGTPSINTYYFIYEPIEIYYGYNSSTNTLYLSKTQTSTATTKGTQMNIGSYWPTCVTVVFENDLRLPFYDKMFSGWHNLVSVQGFENVDLNNKTAKSMFEHCTSLTAAPTLSATTLAKYCYQSMFFDCTSLTTAPALPATTLTQGCYRSMFFDCTSLTTAPALPATTLTQGCYSNMFRGCTSLTTAPALPATTLTQGCYSNMFDSCTSLQVSDTQTELAPYAWTIPTSGTFTNTTTYNQIFMFSYCKGSRGSDNMSGALGESHTYYTQNEPISPVVETPLCFTAVDATEIAISVVGTMATPPTLEYSLDNNTWNAYTLGNTISLSVGGKCYFRGDNTQLADDAEGNYTHFSSTGRINASGNIMSLFDKTFQSTTVPTLGVNHFFYNCTTLLNPPSLPATVVGANGYTSLFEGCTSLTFAPSLERVTSLSVYSLGKFTSSGNINLSTSLTNIETTTFYWSATETETFTYNVYYHFEESDTPQFDTAKVISSGSSKATLTYNLYTNNSTIKNAALALANEYTIVNVYHLDGSAW